MAVHLHLFSDDILVAAESLLPVGVAQHKNRIGSGRLPLRRENQPAQCRLDSCSREVITRYPADDAVFTFAVNGHSDQ